ncbi:MAG TPA: HlyD family type I secretion periplasmic adaptor subunit, partial [Alphaproteobacteria bacterium]|nr:HlyD family type I secretion periplasmic adaptor subunit [Alphaproteobacteria bacterium]
MSEQVLKEIRQLNRTVTIGLALTLGLGGLWAATAPISGAVVARGEVAVEGNQKLIQHPQGGTIAAIMVRDGDRIEAGDV